MTAKTQRGCLFAGALLALIAGCGMSSAKPKADVAVTTFHRQLDAADYAGVWNAADDAYRQATPRDESDKLMEAVHRKLGRVVKSETTNWSMRNFNFKTSVVLTQNTRFEHGSGTEFFTYVVSGNDAKLAGYSIQSMDLIKL
jgi:hypothetical protein